MPKRRGKFVLSSAEEAQLQQLIRAQSTPQGLAQRARVVQLAAQGMGVRAIGGRVGMHYNQVAKWRRRYIRSGLGGLQDEPRSGRKGNISTGALAPDRRSSHAATAGRARWTCRAMARELGVSKATVQRVWSENEIKPHLTRVFRLSTDPDFEAKFWDVIGLYLNPPEQAVVLCCDEKSQIQALQRSQPGLPLGKGHIPHPNPRLLPQRHSHPLCRAGLFAWQSHRSHRPETHPPPVAGVSQANRPRNSF
jgi:transposase